MTQIKKQKSIPKRIMVVAGGTGGHLFPAQALSQALIDDGFDVHLITDKRGLNYREQLSRTSPKLQLHSTSSAPIYAGLFGKIKSAISIIWGMVQSFVMLMRYRPAICVGFGGYPSFPFMRMAQLLNKKTILHDSNAVLGAANQALMREATALAISYKETESLPSRYKTKSHLIGNPMREAIIKATKSPYNTPTPNTDFHLFVTGGSQGATLFGQIIPHAVKSLPDHYQKRLVVTQQCRNDDLETVKAIYKSTSVRTEIAPFFESIADKIAQSHLIVCRSGATTVSEITAIGRPAIYVPMTVHSDEQQKKNALAVVDNQAGLLMVEDSFTVENLSERLETLMNTPESLSDMAKKAKDMGVLDATARFVKLIKEMLKA